MNKIENFQHTSGSKVFSCVIFIKTNLFFQNQQKKTKLFLTDYNN